MCCIRKREQDICAWHINLQDIGAVITCMPLLEAARLRATSIEKIPQILTSLRVNPSVTARKLVAHFLEETGVRLCRRTVARAIVAVRGSTVTQAQAKPENIGAYAAAITALNSDVHVRLEFADCDRFLCFSLAR